MSQQSTSWRTSSYSSGANHCVEIRLDTRFVVRDSTDRTGAVLVFDQGDWTRFVASLR